jgi:uncharacterized membrane protein YdjX (TVP38/TMEM64 family)
VHVARNDGPGRGVYNGMDPGRAVSSLERAIPTLPNHSSERTAPPTSAPPRPAGMGTGAVSLPERRPWYDLGITFTPMQALILLGLLAGGAAFSYALDFVVARFVDLDAEHVERWIEGFGLLAPVVYVGLLASTIIFTPLPSVPVDIAGGLAFGLVLGTLYTLAGAMIGATVNFFLARWLGRGFVERRVGSQAMAQIDAYAERMGARLIFITRLFPLFSFDWVSYAAGLTRMAYRSYALASLLGMVAPVVAIVYVGDVLLTHPGRSAAAFTGLVVWSALPAVAILVWAGGRALHRRARDRGRGRPGEQPP